MFGAEQFNKQTQILLVWGESSLKETCEELQHKIAKNYHNKSKSKVRNASHNQLSG